MDEQLERRLAGILSELEDAEVALTHRQSELAKELAGVDAELEKLQAVKAAIHGKPAPVSSASRVRNPRSKTEENRAKVQAYVAGLDNGRSFAARELADAIDVTYQGIGPILSGMVRRGEIVEADEATEQGHKLYRKTAA